MRIETPLKRFLLFQGKDRYPCGGFDDFEQSFDTAEKAHAHLLTIKPDGLDNWAHIVDLELGKISHEYEGNGYHHEKTDPPFDWVRVELMDTILSKYKLD